MNDLFNAIQQRDGQALARMAGPVNAQAKPTKVIDDQAAAVVSALFEKLKFIFPASTATILKTPDLERAAKREWTIALVKAGMTTTKLLQHGLDMARQSNSDFWPSPGKFIAWCKEGAQKASGLPGVDEIMTEFRRYNRDKGLYESPEAFPWKHPVMYWIVCDARRAMYQRQLTEDDVERYVARKLAEWAKKVSEGECIPNPVKTLPEPPEEPQRAHNATAADYQFRYMPNAAMLGSVTPAQWLMEEFRRRKALGLVN